MSKTWAAALQNQPNPYLTDSELAVLLNSTHHGRYSKVKRLLAQGKLLHIRRGLYCLTDTMNGRLKPHPFELAQYIYGPSYISLESALSFYGLIPERVHTVTSASIHRSKEFLTPLGAFSYTHLPSKNFYTEVTLIKNNGYRFLMATPWKALCDYVFCYKKDWTTLQPLIESLRISPENLPTLRYEDIQKLNAYYHNRRISRFLSGIQKGNLKHER